MAPRRNPAAELSLWGSPEICSSLTLQAPFGYLSAFGACSATSLFSTLDNKLPLILQFRDDLVLFWEILHDALKWIFIIPVMRPPFQLICPKTNQGYLGDRIRHGHEVVGWILPCSHKHLSLLQHTSLNTRGVGFLLGQGGWGSSPSPGVTLEAGKKTDS